MLIKILKTISSIECATELKILPKIFNAATKNLAPADRHFKEIVLDPLKNSSEFILPDNAFGDITFEYFFGYKINKISSNAFNNTAKFIIDFNCLTCQLNDPPNYDLQNVFDQMNKLKALSIELNVTAVPTSVIQPINGQSNLKFIYIESKQKLTIRYGAFQNLDKLKYLHFVNTSLKFETNALKFKNSSIYTVGPRFCQPRFYQIREFVK